MFRSFTRVFLPVFFTCALVLVSIWTAFETKDNFMQTRPTVTYEWIDGQFVVTHNENGQQLRPLVKGFEFLDTIGQSGTSLLSFVIDRGTYVMTAYTAENIPAPEYHDVDGLDDIGLFFQNIGIFFEWIWLYVKATINILLFFVSIPIMVITWILTAVYNVLGFLVTGQSFADLESMVDWMKTHPIGI